MYLISFLYHFRCRKYEPILTDNDISDDDTIDQDDYEQELLALIDKTEEDGPDKSSSGKGDHMKTEGAKQTPKGETLLSDNLTERRFSDYDLNEETKEAFWRGFLQGLKRSERAANEMYNKYTAMIDCKALMREASEDPLLDAGSYLKMIETNQDITHRFLSAWENENRTATTADMGMMGAEHSNTDTDLNMRVSSHSNSECVSRVSSEPKPSPVNNFGEISKSEEKSTKTARSLLVMSKTDIHFDNSLPNTGDNEAAPVARQRPKPKTPRKPEGIWKVHQSSISDTSEIRNLETPELGTMKVILTPKQKEDMSSKNILHVDSADDDVNVFQLAKRRIQSSGLSDMYQILPTKPKSTQKKEQAAKVCDDLFALDDLDGWSTKPFTVQDNLRLSCSEILHPVDSSERFEPPNHNTNTNDGNAKDLLLQERTNACGIMSPRNQSQSADGPLKSTNKSTPHNSPFLGNETLDPNGRTFETNAFKANGNKNKQNPFLADIKNTSDLVRLRLTKSSCSSPNFNKNMPISRSHSLTLQKKFISDLSVTNSIDLSDSLAKQLKSLRKTSQKPPLKAQSYSKKLSTEIHKKDTKMKTKPISRDTLNTNSTQTDVNKVKRFNEMCLSLPQIFPPKLDTSTSLTSRENDSNKPNKTQPVPLPQISGTSLLHDSKANTDNITDAINNYQNALNSIEIRAGNCESTFVFDKNNPEKLRVLARSLLQKQQMCTRCGGITELNRITNKEGHNAKLNGIDFENKKSLRSCKHTYDVESRNPDFDTKMKQDLSICGNLDKSRYDSWAKTKRKEDREEPDTNDFDNEKTVNISYQDKHIKLKCEVTVNDSKDANEPSKNKCKWSPRISEMATARHRENMECPIKKETRIYGTKTKHLYNKGDGNEIENEIQRQEPAAPSPYLEYCKRREKMKANKQDSFHEDFANIISDTSLPDLAGKVRKSKRRKLPIIPKKRSNTELSHSRESKQLKSKSSVTKLIEDSEKCKEESLVVTQCSLPKLIRK